MRILLAYDGSAGAQTAVRLVAALPWEPDSRVRAVSVLPRRPPMLGRAGALDDRHTRPDPQTEGEAAQSLSEVAASLEGTIASDRLLVRGRAADAIARAARRFEADLIVTGSRGRGRVASMLLGSVAAEVAAMAPSPVLVARSDAITSIVLAVDGSAHARAAEDVLLRLRVTRRCPVLIVTVDLDDDVGRAAAGRLVDAGIDATAEVRTGDPTDEVLAAATERGADLIALGTRGHAGVRRLFMGSVARNVLESAAASVVIARAPHAGRSR